MRSFTARSSCHCHRGGVKAWGGGAGEGGGGGGCRASLDPSVVHASRNADDQFIVMIAVGERDQVLLAELQSQFVTRQQTRRTSCMLCASFCKQSRALLSASTKTKEQNCLPITAVCRTPLLTLLPLLLSPVVNISYDLPHPLSATLAVIWLSESKLFIPSCGGDIVLWSCGQQKSPPVSPFFLFILSSESALL